MEFRHTLFLNRNLLIAFSILHLAFLLGLNTKAQEVSLGPLKNPWGGGLNSCQYGSIDLDLDGMDDLVIFDRHGNRILPYLYDGFGGTQGYRFHPELITSLPSLTDWVIFRDFNCDGKQDIFTYANGGIKVYQNTSGATLAFTLLTNLLESFYFTGKIGILVTLVDYPAIEDVDNDGDLDILTFAALGSFVEYHKNLSMERYGTCDSLDYRLADQCWGDFKESGGSNLIVLDVTCPYKYTPLPQNPCANPRGAKHTGSTFAAFDANGDQITDVLIGDVDFPNLKFLLNGGTVDSAHMISQDTTFPSYSEPVKLFSFPAASLVDIDKDGNRDMLVSPFDPSLTSSENRKSNWFYRNNGTDFQPDFHLVEKGLFQYEMIDVGSNAYPLLTDVDRDGFTDLLVGNYGVYDSSYYQEGYLFSTFTSRLSYYRNTGVAFSPAFQLITDDLGGLSTFNLIAGYPACGDLDADGDADLVVGNADGTLLFLRNAAGSGSVPAFESSVLQYGGIDVGDFSTPQLFDLDGDGKLDLVIGEQKGNINYYRNSGSLQEPLFTLVTDSLGKVNVTNPSVSYNGFSTPFFFHDKSGNTALLVGCEEGNVHFFTDIDGNLEGAFTPSDDLIEDLTQAALPGNLGWRSSVTAGFLTDASELDLIVGNYSGGLNYVTNHSFPGVISSLPSEPFTPSSLLKIYPNPADEFIVVERNENKMEPLVLRVYDLLGRILFESAFTNKLKISIRDIPSGYYLVNIGRDQGKFFILRED
jgi:hypothetical protein